MQPYSSGASDMDVEPEPVSASVPQPCSGTRCGICCAQVLGAEVSFAQASSQAPQSCGLGGSVLGERG